MAHYEPHAFWWRAEAFFGLDQGGGVVGLQIATEPSVSFVFENILVSRLSSDVDRDWTRLSHEHSRQFWRHQINRLAIDGELRPGINSGFAVASNAGVFCRFPSVPMMMRHKPPGSLPLRALKDHHRYAYVTDTEQRRGWCRHRAHATGSRRQRTTTGTARPTTKAGLTGLRPRTSCCSILKPTPPSRAWSLPKCCCAF